MTNQVQIRFTASGCSSSTGNFAPGDLLRCSKAEAKHFVNEACCAEYVKAPAPGPLPAPADGNGAAAQLATARAAKKAATKKGNSP